MPTQARIISIQSGSKSRITRSNSKGVYLKSKRHGAVKAVIAPLKNEGSKQFFRGYSLTEGAIIAFLEDPDLPAYAGQTIDELKTWFQNSAVVINAVLDPYTQTHLLDFRILQDRPRAEIWKDVDKFVQDWLFEQGDWKEQITISPA